MPNRTYDPTKLVLNDPTNLQWALNWARFLSKDMPNQGGDYPLDSLTDAEWTGLLEVTAHTSGTTRYYRPHQAAAMELDTNPYRVSREELEGNSQEFRRIEEVTAAIQKFGGFFEGLIEQAEAEAGRTYGGVKTWQPVW